MKIQFNDLKDQYLDYKKVKKKISKIIDERNYILGKSVFDLEKKLSNFIGSKYCVTTSSGTDALLIALLSLNLKKISKPKRLNFNVITSSIRFTKNGIIKQSLLNQFLKILFLLKFDNKKMNKEYEKNLNLNSKYE